MRWTLVLFCLALCSCITDIRYVGTVPPDAATEVCDPSPTGRWRTVASGTTSDLTAVWGSGPNDVWASSMKSSALLHYDGSRWSSVEGSAKVTSLWGSAADDVWGVGGSGAMVHWDGATWTAVPGFEANRNFLTVWGFGRNDVWAAGASVLAITYPLVAHWDGTAWKQAGLPKTESGTAYIAGLWGTSSTDLWAVGQELLAHWDGTSWTRYEATGTTYSRVWGSSTSDVWVVGSRDALRSVVRHWDGSSWSDVTQMDYVAALWGTSSRDVWVAGNGAGSIKHWNGCSWRAVPADTDAFVQAIWSAGPSDVWAVGLGGAILHFSEDANPPDAGIPAEPDAGPSTDAGPIPADGGAVVCAIGQVVDSTGKCVDQVCNSDGWCWEEPKPLGGFFSAIRGLAPPEPVGVGLGLPAPVRRRELALPPRAALRDDPLGLLAAGRLGRRCQGPMALEWAGVGPHLHCPEQDLGIEPQRRLGHRVEEHAEQAHRDPHSPLEWHRVDDDRAAVARRLLELRAVRFLEQGTSGRSGTGPSLRSRSTGTARRGPSSRTA
ncbi:MAG: hypothetical protein QM765_31375 [Myxococcales bacterium]